MSATEPFARLAADQYKQVILVGNESDQAADKKADLKAAMIVFTMLVLGAIHFVSGWTFDWTYDLF